MPTYLSEHVYTGNGATTDYIFNKGYLSRSHVIVKVSTDGGDTYTTMTDPDDYEWIDSQTISFAVAPVADAVIWLDRVTPRTIDLTYANGTVFTDTTQNYDYRQPMYILQEMLDELDRRPALGVEQEDVEETLAQVMGNLTLDGTNLVASTFNLKAAVGRDSSGRLVISLTKESEADTEIAIPGAVEAEPAVRTGGLRIADYTPTLFGSELFFDDGGVPTRPGITPDSHLDESEEWDGVFPYPRPSTEEFTAGRATGLSEPPDAFVRQFKIQTASGEYTNLHPFSRVYLSGNDWLISIYPYTDAGNKYAQSITYIKTTVGDAYPPPWGEYTYSAANTGSLWKGAAGNNFPATLTIEPV